MPRTRDRNSVSWVHRVNPLFSQYPVHPMWVRPQGCTCPDTHIPYGKARRRLKCATCKELAKYWESLAAKLAPSAVCSMCGRTCRGEIHCRTGAYSLGSIEHAADIKAHWFTYASKDDGVDPERVRREGGEYICGHCVDRYLKHRLRVE